VVGLTCASCSCPTHTLVSTCPAARGSFVVADHDVPLTATEFRLLIKLMKAPGRTFSRSELVECVLSEDRNALERTIDAYVMNLRRSSRPIGRVHATLSRCSA
jgi:DNA-binding response OmpR family regulator